MNTPPPNNPPPQTPRPNSPIPDTSPHITPAPQALTPDQLYEIKTAEHRAHKITAASKIAAFNGWSLGFMAVLSAFLTVASVPFTGSIDFFDVIVTVALVVLTRNEFKGRAGLLQFDPRAAILLGRNQVGLVIIVIIYCITQTYLGTHPSAELQEQYAQLEQLGLSNMQSMSDTLYIAVYGAIGVASMILQGYNAIYYFRRKKMIQLYHYHTPDWVIELKRPGHSR